MTPCKELWNHMLKKLEVLLNPVDYDAWFSQLEPVQVLDGDLVLCATTERLRDFIAKKFQAELKQALNQVSPIMSDVKIIAPEEKSEYKQEEVTVTAEEEEDEPPQKLEVVSFNPEFIFSEFVTGDSNRRAFILAKEVCISPGGDTHNPLFIYGGSGLGKTHLLHAIGNELRFSKPHLKVLYVSSEKFVNDFIDTFISTKGKKTSSFRNMYRGFDVLMIDDIQFIASKAKSQEEFFHTFNAMYDSGRQLVFTSDRPPKELHEMPDRLQSRLNMGGMADIQTPDLETRIAILEKKALKANYRISRKPLEAIAEEITDNVRNLKGMLNRVMMLSRLHEKPPSVEMVKEALKDFAVKTEEAVTADRVIECVCKYFKPLSKEDLEGKKKTRDITDPRQIAMYLIKEFVGLPLA
ncbi:MAG: chromosomal replication initiator protein DnaA, partial [Firmicutes bacterium]|nr:chromosomal replication initiator protein DnaA [Bacillota bacterium]